MMTEEVTNTAGASVHVLDVSDLNRAQAKVIKAVVGVGLFCAFTVGVWVTQLQAANDAQDVILSDYQSHAAWSRDASRNLDSLRIEMRHLSETTADLTRTVNELSRLLERRGVR